MPDGGVLRELRTMSATPSARDTIRVKEGLNRPARAICERSCVIKRRESAGILDACQV